MAVRSYSSKWSAPWPRGMTRHILLHSHCFSSPTDYLNYPQYSLLHYSYRNEAGLYEILTFLQCITNPIISSIYSLIFGVFTSRSWINLPIHYNASFEKKKKKNPMFPQQINTKLRIFLLHEISSAKH